VKDSKDVLCVVCYVEEKEVPECLIEEQDERKMHSGAGKERLPKRKGMVKLY
jgi:hypothetical protein